MFVKVDKEDLCVAGGRVKQGLRADDSRGGQALRVAAGMHDGSTCAEGR